MSGVEIPTGYTPGPWQVGKVLHGVVFAWELPPGHPDAVICDAGNDANARLIALAPEMAAELSALRSQVSALTEERDKLREGGLTQAATDVLAERRRQVEVEGWTAEHDDQHDQEEIARAAAAYAVAGTLLDEALYIHGRWVGLVRDLLWPKTWDEVWLKSGSRRRNLVKSGALILAAIEQRDRAALSPKPEGE